MDTDNEGTALELSLVEGGEVMKADGDDVPGADGGKKVSEVELTLVERMGVSETEEEGPPGMTGFEDPRADVNDEETVPEPTLAGFEF